MTAVFLSFLHSQCISLPRSLSLFVSQSNSLFLCERLYHGSRPPRKQTSVGSLSNSIALLHHNQPPAVIVAILPATTLSGGEVQFNRAAQIPPRQVENTHHGLLGSRKQEQGEFFLCPVAHSVPSQLSAGGGKAAPFEEITGFLSFLLSFSFTLSKYCIYPSSIFFSYALPHFHPLPPLLFHS